MEDYPGNPGGKNAKTQNFESGSNHTPTLSAPHILPLRYSSFNFENSKLIKFQRVSGNCY